ncbi:cyclic di-GMP phosphodiesterase response regulator RpfG [Abditibacteriota bacterium]|nr:cyclic di-GMP phosphodiesterase response regulator RpfG [Abditibacteriota bacterium]
MFSFSVDARILRSSSLRAEAPGDGAGRDPQSLLERTIEEIHPQIRADKQQLWHQVLTVSGLLIAVYAWLCFFHPFGEATTKNFSNVFTAFMAYGGALACIMCALTRRDENRAWRAGFLVFGVGWVFNALGESVWVVVETWQHHELPSPSLADACFVASYVTLLAGLVVFYLSSCPLRRMLTALDSALLAGSVGALAWFFILQPVWLARAGKEPIATWVALFYPLFDVLLLWGAIALIYAPAAQGARRRAVTLIACATTVFAFADLWYAFLDVSGRYSSGGWNDLAIGASYAGVALAMLAITWERNEGDNWGGGGDVSAISEDRSIESENVSLRRVLLPYLFALSAFSLIAFVEWTTTGTLGLDVLVWCVVFLCVILGRQMLSLTENVHLARQLRELNTGLDKQVRARTRQIDALLQLTKAVNASLVESEVLDHAVSSARHAIPMNVAAVWNWDEGEDRAHLAVAEGTFLGATGPTPTNGLSEALSSEHLCQLAREAALKGEALDCCGDDLGFSVIQGSARKRGLVPCLHLEPILFNGRVLAVLGALRVSSVRSTSAFTAEEARLLEKVGLEVGTALENARIYSRALEAADLDPATGLLNHRALQGRFDAAWESSEKERTPLSVVMMDLNNFKNFNDLYGHLVGDEVLRLVAGVLTETCRGDDIAARYGGDEFFMLLPDTDAAGALRVAQRLQEHMAKVEVRPAGSREALPIALSFGVATAPTDAHSKLDLIAAADRNLYIAKGSQEAIHSTSAARQKRLVLPGGEGVAALDSMVTAVSNADAYTRQHSEDVTEYALWIADELGLDEETRRTIEVGGMLHDVGKICVPQDVLKKPGRLTDTEFAAMQTHPSLGALLVGAVLPDAGVLQIVRSHHERYDGRGYPDSLQGEDIPLLGRLVAVADAFSAMTTSRPYRKALSLEQARHEIERGIGTQFDPHLADAFIRALDKRNNTP